MFVNVGLGMGLLIMWSDRGCVTAGLKAYRRWYIPLFFGRKEVMEHGLAVNEWFLRDFAPKFAHTHGLPSEKFVALALDKQAQVMW